MIKKHAEKISQVELEEKAMQAGNSWHHHCLPVNCFTNDTGEEVIVLEAGNDTFYCETTKELKKKLEEHAYQLTHPRKVKGRHPKHEALDKIKEYVKDGVKWHFHIAMPHCLLSMGDKYVLILENDETKQIQQWEFDEKPVALVRAIDDNYLGRKKVAPPL
ncbi:hypothetical protein KKF61_06790 [Patescibacteria group bacterium]|nr:hypothetical protein [Patescibacteria group bacterium]MBU0963706.1 hypothetical protein [Patescibacteria group bacterium]